MFSHTLSQLDLAKNEAILYETLLRLGEASAGQLSTKSHVNRRNVYDSIDRLIEKGLIFEIKVGREVSYRAVDPNKLLEKVDEKRTAVEKILPDLLALYQSESHQEDVYIYRGLEGWKNYLRDILRVGKEVYTIGGKGAWSDPRLRPFFLSFQEQAKKKSIPFYTLYDHEVKQQASQITSLHTGMYRFLPKKYSSPAAVDVFGDHVVISTALTLDTIDEHASFTIIINQPIADAFRVWFKALWEQGEELQK